MSTENNNAQQGQPCANPECSFSGHIGFDNYCSVCYKIQVNNNNNNNSNNSSAKTKEREEDKMEVDSAVAPAVTEEKEKEAASESSSSSSAAAASADVDATAKTIEKTEQGEEEEEKKPAKKVQKNRKRCFECRKKVGILGFECRCGFVYCGKHRYPDEHQCEFDHAEFDKQRLANAHCKVAHKKVDVL